MGEHLCLEQAWRNRQFRFIQSNCSLVQKALQTFFQCCKKQSGDAALGCSSGCFQLSENRAQITGTAPGRAFSPLASPEASCACVWRAEGKETQDQNSSLLRVPDEKFCLSVATVREMT